MSSEAASAACRGWPHRLMRTQCWVSRPKLLPARSRRHSGASLCLCTQISATTRRRRMPSRRGLGPEYGSSCGRRGATDCTLAQALAAARDVLSDASKRAALDEQRDEAAWREERQAEQAFARCTSLGAVCACRDPCSCLSPARLASIGSRPSGASCGENRYQATQSFSVAARARQQTCPPRERRG